MRFFLLFLSLLSAFAFYAQERTQPETQAPELGKIAWYRDYNDALSLAKKSDKPVFILFQEVPGCLTCRNYGKGVLSHPVIVAAIEDRFIPLAIFNNKGGEDRQVLKRYGEPSWNNPVVRITDNNGKDLIKRIAGDYSKEKVASEIIRILENRQEAVPLALRNVAKSLRY